MIKFSLHKIFNFSILYIAGLVSILLLFILMSLNIINLSEKSEFYNGKLSEMKISSSGNLRHTETTNSKKLENINKVDAITIFRSGEKSILESLPFTKNDVKDFSNFLIMFNNSGLVSKNNGTQNTCLPEIELWKINQDGTENKIASANSIDDSKILKVINNTEKSYSKNFKYYLSKLTFNLIQTPWVYKKLTLNRFIYQKIFNEDISESSVIKISSFNNITQVNLRISLNGQDYVVTNAYFSNNSSDFVPGINNIFININSVLNGININSSVGVKLKEIYVFIDDQSEPLKIPIDSITFYSNNDTSTKTFLVDSIENKNINYLDFNIFNIFEDYNNPQLFKFKYFFTNRNKLDICKVEHFSTFAYNKHIKKISTLANDLSIYYKSPDVFSTLPGKSNFSVYIPEYIVPLSVFRNKKFDDEVLHAISYKNSTEVLSETNYGSLKISFINGISNNILLRLKPNQAFQNKYLYVYNGSRGIDEMISFSSAHGLLGQINYKTAIPLKMDFLPIITDYINISIPINDIDIILNDGFYSIGILDIIPNDISDHKKYGLPYYVKYSPVITGASGSNVRVFDNSVSGSINSLPLKFSIDISSDLLWVNDFTLQYNFSKSNYLRSCPINLDIIFASGRSVKRNYCVNNYSGFIKLNISELGILENSFGPISKFNWSIEPVESSFNKDVYAKFIFELTGGIFYSNNLTNLFENFDYLILDSGAKVSSSNINKFIAAAEPHFKSFNNNYLNLSFFVSFILILLININGYNKLFNISFIIINYKILLYYISAYNIVNIFINFTSDKYINISISDYVYLLIFILSLLYAIYNEFSKKINHQILFLIIILLTFIYIFSDDIFGEKTPFSALTIFLIFFLSHTTQITYFLNKYFIHSLIAKKITSGILFTLPLFILIPFSPPLVSNLLLSITLISISVLLINLSTFLPAKFIVFKSNTISLVVFLIFFILLLKLFGLNVLIYYLSNILFIILIYLSYFFNSK